MNTIKNQAIAKLAQNTNDYCGFCIHPNWFNLIKNDKQQVHLLAVDIYAYIVDWFMPIKDESTGLSSQKFSGDKLQLSYKQIADQFGISKYNAKNAFLLLQSLGLITLEFRIAIINGIKMSNVLFIDLNYDEYIKSLGKGGKTKTVTNAVSTNVCRHAMK